MKPIWCCVALLTAVACGDDEERAEDDGGPGDAYVEGTFVLVDDSEVSYQEISASLSTNMFRTCEGRLSSASYTIGVGWMNDDLPAIGDYAVDGLATFPQVVAGWPNSEGGVRLSWAHTGSLRFSEVDLDPGGIVAGTFDDLDFEPDLTDPDDLVSMVTDGTFRCHIE